MAAFACVLLERRAERDRSHQEAWEGRTIFVRYVWSEITRTSAHFEQAFSDDGGKTWEVNWITDQSRVE